METVLEVVGPITVKDSEQYPVIITDHGEGVAHFFLVKEGELFYDGYCRPGSSKEAPDSSEAIEAAPAVDAGMADGSSFLIGQRRPYGH